MLRQPEAYTHRRSSLKHPSTRGAVHDNSAATLVDSMNCSSQMKVSCLRISVGLGGEQAPCFTLGDLRVSITRDLSSVYLNRTRCPPRGDLTLSRVVIWTRQISHLALLRKY